MPVKAPAGVWETACLILALVGAVVLITVSLSTAWSNTADDAYITLRYAGHLAEGRGVLWNPGEPAVEGYSNFLFVVLGAALMKLGGAGAFDPMPWLKALGAAAAVGSLVLTFAIAGRRFGLAAGAAAVLVLAVHPGQSFWAVSGMETAVCQALILLAVYLVVTAESARAGRDRRLVLASVTLFAASITRPESPILFAPFLAFVLSRPSSADGLSRFHAARRLTGPFLALYLPYTAWRLWTFGRWLPNSAVCKAGYWADPFYLGREFLHFAGPLLALAVAGLVFGRRREHWLLAGIPLVYFATFYAVDPIMSHLDRHFLAALPPLTVAAVHGLQVVTERLLPLRRRALAGLAVLIVALVFAAGSAPRTLAKVRQAVRLAHPLEHVRRELGTYLQAKLRPGEAFAIGDTGLVPFLAGGTALDVYCLNCREATAPPIDRSPERLADWILARRPRFVVVQASNAASERGVWPADRALQNHPLLARRYSPGRKFGEAGDPLGYLVFERRSGGSF